MAPENRTDLSSTEPGSTPAMTTDPHTPGAWPAGTRIRPVADQESADVEVVDAVTGRRFRWKPEALSAHLLGGGAPSGVADHWRRAMGDGADRRHLLPGWKHWLDRGWTPSDTAYLASRRFRYTDLDDADGRVRAETVGRFIEAGGPPAEHLQDGRTVDLGDPPPPADRPLAEVLVRRRSGRTYAPGEVGIDRLSGLLWHALGHVRERRRTQSPDEPLSYLRSFGSAWDFYLCAYAVDGLEPGVYRYDVEPHRVIEVRRGDHRETMVNLLQGMASPRTAAWTLAMVADFPRYQWRYRHEHGLRRLYLESGIIAQELVVLAESYGLSSLVTPAQKDRGLLDLLDLDRIRYSPIYTVTSGPTKGRRGIDFGGFAAAREQR